MWSMALPLPWPSRAILPALKHSRMIWRGGSQEDTSVRFSYLPALRALLALNHGDPAKALELLQIAAPYELGAPRSSVHGFFGALYPVYVRGEAYLASHQGAEAAAEFQKILDHRGIVVSDPIGALAHLQLGRASLCREIRSRPRLPTRISSPSGKMPIPTFRFSSKPRPNTPSCSEQRMPNFAGRSILPGTITGVDILSSPTSGVDRLDTELAAGGELSRSARIPVV